MHEDTEATVRVKWIY